MPPVAMPHPHVPSLVPAETPVGEVQRLFAGQRATALALRRSTAAERIAKLRRLCQLLLDRREAIMAACQADFGKPAAEVETSEILPVVSEARLAMRRLRRWMRPRRRGAPLLLLGTRAEVRTEPRGRCLVISPWNYPINLSLGPLVSAIAAGNTVILKPSELTPHCAQLLAELVGELFEEGEVTVIQGGVATAQALLELPFDHIFFTGSPAIGRRVMSAAARHLTSVTLELGGKSPAIVDASANVADAAATLVWAKFANAGQTCIAPDHVYVHAEVRAAFEQAAVAALRRLYGASETWATNPDYCRIIAPRQLERQRELLDDALARGARLLCGGEMDAARGHVAPTLLVDVDPEARLMQEEIFGPLLPILEFTDLDALIDTLNGSEKPLALYVHGQDGQRIERLLTEVSAGGSCVNAALLHFMHHGLPFGGVNHSGIGQSHGHAGYLAFSHERAVLRDRFSLAFLFRPPYTAMTRRLIRLATRWLG